MVIGRVKNCSRENVVNLGPSLTYHDQDLPYFYADNFSRDHWPMKRQLRNFDEMYIGRSVIAGIFIQPTKI